MLTHRSIALVTLTLATGIAVAACEEDGGSDGGGPTTSTTGGGLTTSSAGGSGGSGLAPTGGASTGGTTGVGGSGGTPSGVGGGATTTTSTPTLVHDCPPAGGLDCTPGTGDPQPEDCGDAPSCFLSTVQQVVNALIASNPSAFYPVPEHSDCPAPYDVVWFMDSVVAALQAEDLCATRDPPSSEEEVSVKLNNAYAENFDIVASWGCARTGSGIYTGFCTEVWW